MPAGEGEGAGAAAQDVGFAPAQSFETRLQQLQTDRAARLRLTKEDLVTLESFLRWPVDVGTPLRYQHPLPAPVTRHACMPAMPPLILLDAVKAFGDQPGRPTES